MNAAPTRFFPRLKLFLALSRTPHGIIDLSTPALAALLCLGHFPPLSVTLVGLVTVFAGYTAVYALNDLVDYRIDKEKVRYGGYTDGENFLDGVLVRHPLAKGVLPVSEGIAWASGWAMVAMVGAWWLNPICFFIFLLAGVLEVIYCRLWQVTPLRGLVNGLVKSMGAMAAIFAVDPSPSFGFLLAFLILILFWEIGGQNIPADWTDIEEDRRFNAKTLPVKLGQVRASRVAMVCLVMAFFVTFLVLWVSPLPFGPIELLMVTGLSIWLILMPVLRLTQGTDRRLAMDLFNHASYYPLSLLIVTLIRMLVNAGSGGV